MSPLYDRLPSAIRKPVRLQKLERAKGIEPSSSAWKAVALPLSYARPETNYPTALSLPTFPPTCTPPLADTIPSKTVIFLACQISHRHIAYGRCTGWWRGLDSNQRRHSQRVYSPSPLTARAPLHPGQLHCSHTAHRKIARQFAPSGHQYSRHKQRREAKHKPAHAPCLGQSEYVLTAVNVNPFPVYIDR